MEWTNRIIRIVLYIFIVWTVFRLIRISLRLTSYKRELKYAERLRGSPNAEIVSAKIIGLHEKQLSRWDILYTANVVYKIGEMHYIRNVCILNKGSLRTGANLRLIADKNEPQKAVAEGGSQSDIIRICRRYIIVHIFLLACLVLCVIFFYWFSIKDILVNMLSDD